MPSAWLEDDRSGEVGQLSRYTPTTMRAPPPAPWRALVTATLALALAGGPAAVHAAPADRTELLGRAQSQLDAGNYRGAAESYAAYYEALGNDRTSVAGENAVLVAADAYRQAWDAHADRADLLAAQTLLQAHIAGFEAATGSASGAGVDEAKAESAWFAAKLEETAPAEPSPAAGAVVEPSEPPREQTPPEPERVGARVEPVVGPTPITGDEPETAPSRQPDRVGLGLTIGGAAGVAAGIFGVTYGSLWNRSIDDTADAAVPGGNVPDDVDPEAWRSDQKKVGLGLQIGGAALLAVGSGLLTYGIIRLVRRSRPKGTARRSRPSRGLAPL